MAQLKDTIISGNLRVTNAVLTDTLQADSIQAHSTTSDTSAITNGTDGQVLKTNGTLSYWGDLPTIPTISLNGESTTSASFYAPTVTGTNGQVLTSNGSGAPAWSTLPETYIKPSTGIPDTDLASNIQEALTKAANAPKIFHGTCSTAAATADKVVVCPEFTAADLVKGALIFVSFDVVNSAAVANLTMNVNGTGALRLTKQYNTSGAANLMAPAELRNSTFLFTILVSSENVMYWTCLTMDYNTTYNTGNNIRYGRQRAGNGAYAVTRYSLLMEKPDGTWEKITNTSQNYTTATTKTVNTSGFLLGHILYYNSTTNYGTGALIASSVCYDSISTLAFSYSANCGTAPGWAVGDPIFLVGTLGADGLFYLDTTQWWANDYPSTDDGKLYIHIGYALTATDSTMSLILDKAVYHYKDGAVRLWTSQIEYITPDQIAVDASIIDSRQEQITPVYESNYISKTDGSLVASETAKHVTINLGSAKSMRFLGAYTKTDAWTSGYAWYDSNDTVITSHAWDYGASDNTTKDYILDVPEGAAYFRTSVNVVSSLVTEENFYCYLRYEDVTNKTELVSLALYEKDVIDIAQVAVQDCYASGTEWVASGNHISIKVNEGDIVEIIGNATNATNVFFVAGAYCPIATKALGYTQSTFEIAADTKYLLMAPPTTVQVIINTIVSSVNVAPQSIIIYRDKEKLADTSTRCIESRRFNFSDNTITAINNVSSYSNDLFNVKKGHRYHIRHRSNAVGSYHFITDVPRIGLATTWIWTIQASSLIADSSYDFTAPEDGFILARYYKDGGGIEKNTVVTPFAFGAQAKEGLSDADQKLLIQSLKWRRVKYTEPERLNYIILAGNTNAGRWNTDTTSKHILIPVTAGQYIKFAPNRGVSTAVAFLTSTDCASGAVPPYAEGTGVIFYSSDGVERLLVAPDDANYMYLNRSNAPEYIELSEDVDSIPVIVRVNEEEKTKQLLGQLKSQTRKQKASETENKPLVLLHFSDIHGMGQNLSRINEYRRYWSKYIDDTINTGDVQQDRWEDDFIFGEASADNPNNDILSVIGNHDTATGTGSSRDWHAKQGKESYDRYIAPFVTYWGAVQPDNAATNGYCYYYKDYPDSHIRLIVLDSYNSNTDYISAQTAWLEGVLDGAREAGYSVVMAAHMGLESEELIKCPFTNNGAAYTSPDLAPWNTPYMNLVTQFKAAGGELVCWLAGHSHYDAIARTSEVNGYQINIRVANASRDYNPDLDLNTTNSKIEVIADDIRSQDLFNIVAIDTTYKFITLFRVGAQWDKLGRQIETTCIAYNTGNIVYADSPVKALTTVKKIWSGTQAEYDLLTPDSDTLYLITG